MTEADWADPTNHVLGMLILGEATDEIDERGRRLMGEAILLLTNGGARSRPFTLPQLETPGAWVEMLNTAHPNPAHRPSGQGEPGGPLAHAAAPRAAAVIGCPRSAPPIGCSCTPASPSPRPAPSSPT